MIVVAGRQGTHGIEHRGHAPVQFLAAADKHHVLGAVADQVCAEVAQAAEIE
jgi:hypothetical protein